MPLITPFTGNYYTRLPEAFYQRLAPESIRAPSWMLVNRSLANEIEAMPAWLDTEDALQALSGNASPQGGDAIALAYSGHQFGHWVPLLGDGRALLLGQVKTRDSTTLDVQLKGSGPTRFSRGGDGRATLASAIREYIVSEAMHGLGIPTTRSLAVCATGEFVMRESPEPGAVLTRLARSHLRVGSFQYAASSGDTEHIPTLVEHVIAMIYPQLRDEEQPALALLREVITTQAELIARWMLVGFIHGVMNTDNMSISGETIDYGPCAFIDEFHPQKVFSSIDRHGRYAWGRQPSIALWNLTRFAETLLPLLADDEQAAIAVAMTELEIFTGQFSTQFLSGMCRKLGIRDDRPDANAFIDDTFQAMTAGKVDFTLFFRNLTLLAAGGEDDLALNLFTDAETGTSWLSRWKSAADLVNETGEQRIDGQRIDEPRIDIQRLDAMRAANPIFIARNHRVEQAIRAAVDHNDFSPTLRLCAVLARPFDEQPEHAELESPPQASEIVQQTFCGT